MIVRNLMDKAYIPQVRDLRFWNYSRLIFTFLPQ